MWAAPIEARTAAPALRRPSSRALARATSSRWRDNCRIGALSSRQTGSAAYAVGMDEASPGRTRATDHVAPEESAKTACAPANPDAVRTGSA